ncbi:hypothetical protein TRIP_B330168 [uncultured Desulfatiglans sp.]|uniref:Uncharacterized protein n=1 Tax=Uncultured Desulfatiglans sp. TaxID=1748965 RepID=A0A653A7D4_UNCDX|nr:hypothetical protein TRIP_B330168 [uncultured Desulfatiglans sp.]
MEGGFGGAFSLLMSLPLSDVVVQRFAAGIDRRTMKGSGADPGPDGCAAISAGDHTARRNRFL